jgi:hypothetical protein
MSSYKEMIRPINFNFWKDEYLKLIKKTEEIQLLLKTDSIKNAPNVQKDNYYIATFHAGHQTNAIDTGFNKEGKLTYNADYPLFCWLQDFYKEGQKHRIIEYQAIESVVMSCLYDRTNHIISNKKSGPVMSHLLAQTVRHIHRYAMNMRNSHPNALKKFGNRVVYIPRRMMDDGTLINDGNWTFKRSIANIDGFDNYDLAPNEAVTVLSDAFRDKLSETELQEIKTFLSETGRFIGENSESSINKGVFTDLSPGLMKAKVKFNKENPHATQFVIHRSNDKGDYDSNAFYVDKEGHILTIYSPAQKAYQRTKLSNADVASYADNDKAKLDCNGNPLFFRNRSYLNSNTENINKELHDSSRTHYNVFVVYKEGSTKFNQIIGEDESKYFDNFKNADKNRLNFYANDGDCHIKLSPEVADETIIINRSLSFDAPKSCYTTHLNELLDRMEHEENIEFEPEEMTNILAYNFECPSCQSGIMYPGRQRMTSVITSYIEKDKCDDLQFEWVCRNCDYGEKVEENNRGEPSHYRLKKIKLNSNFKESRGCILYSIKKDPSSNQINIQMGVKLPLDQVRAVADLGLKGFAIATGHQYTGKFKGKMKSFDLSKDIDISEFNVDAIVPYGSMKGKNEGITLSMIKFINAVSDEKINPYDYFPVDDNGDIVVHGANDTIQELNQKINEWYKQSDLQWIYHDIVESEIDGVVHYNLEEKTLSSKDGLRFGILEIGATESNTEYFKMKNKSDSMKMSPQFDMALRLYGKHKLCDMIANISYDSLNSEFNSRVLKELIACHNGVALDYYAEVNAEDFRTNSTVPFIEEMQLPVWLREKNRHSIFNNPKYSNGFVLNTGFVDKYGEIHPFKISVPSREVIEYFIKTNISAGVVRLPGFLVKLFEMLKFAENANNPIKMTFHRKLMNKINAILWDKKGLINKFGAHRLDGIQAKKIDSGLLPVNAIVVADNKFWSKVYNKMYQKDYSYDQFIEKIGDYDEFRNDLLHFYGYSIRHPMAWLNQTNLPMEIWHPNRANNYFLKKYGCSFYEMYPSAKNNQLMLMPTLHDLMFDMGDSDGDAIYIPTIFDYAIQKELAKDHELFTDYRFLYNEDNPHCKVLSMIWRINHVWHIKYVKEELESNTAIKANCHKDFKILYNIYNYENRTNAMVDAAISKSAIGLITNTMWMFMMIGMYLHSSKYPPKDLKMSLDEWKDKEGFIDLEELIGIVTFYQSNILQDGVIRAIKHVAGALGSMNMSDIAVNTAEVPSSNDEINEDVKPRRKLLEIARKNNYPERFINKMFDLCDWWCKHGAMNENGRISAKVASEEGKMIRAFTSLIYSNNSGLGDHSFVIPCLRSNKVDDHFMYLSHHLLIETIRLVPPGNALSILNVKKKDK